ncbi:MAG: peptidylprolyl isomerase [Planctomycetota bacterium]
MHTASILLGLLLAGGQETPAPASDGASREGWRDFDVVLQIVNERMLTSRTLIREMGRFNKRRPITSEGEAREAEKRIRTESVTDALRIQAGEDLGTDPVQLDRQVKDIMRRMQERYQGSAGMSLYLQERDRTLYEEQELTRDILHATLWDNYITGDGSVGDGARPLRDSYVRPGYLRFTYRQCLEHPELLQVIGGSGPSVVLQQLFVDPASAGGEEAGLVLAEDLRERIVAGEDMGNLVESYDAAASNKQKRGMTEPLLESRLEDYDPAVGIFVAEAKPGDVSEPLPFKSKDKSYWRIVRLVERRASVIPPLDSIEAQTKLTERIREDLSDWRRSEGIRKLVKASYIWPQDLIPR